MFRWLWQILPTGIAGQIIILVIGGVLLFQFASSAVFFMVVESAERPWPSPPALADRFASFVRVLDQVPIPARQEALSSVQNAYPELRIRISPAENRSHGTISKAFLSAEEDELLRFISRTLGVNLIPSILADRGANGGHGADERPREVAVALHDGVVVTASLAVLKGPLREARPIVFVLLTLGLIATMLVAFLWWATRALTAPLARFAATAEEFSLDRQPSPLSEKEGPDEVQTASRALNRLQARVRDMVEDRTRMLAAVSHDLRTPITRIRLRAEFIDQEDTRRQMFRDLEQMERMVNGVVSYLRDGKASHQRTLIDLASLLQTVCDDFSDLGEQVAFEGPGNLLVYANSDDIQRAIVNLVENALKYGGSTAVRLQSLSTSEIQIDVIDSGPGIPDSLKDAMLEPFARADAARNLNDQSSGFGLGLAIVRATAEAYGGRLELLDQEPSGLVARLILRAQPDHVAPCPTVTGHAR